MKCPVCKSTELLMSERQGVEIDYCPACRGIWLDRGELDKIIERYSAEPGPDAGQGHRDPRPGYPPPYPPPFSRDHEPSHDHDKYHDRKPHGFGGYGGHHKKKSLLKDLFDFD